MQFPVGVIIGLEHEEVEIAVASCQGSIAQSLLVLALTQ